MTDAEHIRRAARDAQPDAVAARAAFGGSCALQPVVLLAGDVDRVSELHERTYAGAVPETMRHDQPAFFAEIAAGGGALLGLEGPGGGLVAYGVLSLPGPHASPCCRLLGLAPSSPVAQLDGIAVDPAWRGNGLQRRLGQWRMATAARLGHSHICSTAAPRNVHSWMNLLSLGLVIRGLHVMYGGSLRYVLHCDLEAAAPVAAVREIAVSDLDRHRELFKVGCAAIGWTGGARPAGLLFACPPGRC